MDHASFHQFSSTDTPGAARRQAALPSTAACHREAVGRVINEMRARLDEPLPLRHLAEVAAISHFHFNRVFRQVTGIPPCQFLYALRMEVAKRLLLTTDLSVTDVCFEVGYNSLGTFIRRFNDLLGLSPSRLRALAHTSAEALLDGFCRPAARTAARPAHGTGGRVDAPANFRGLIFVGLFTSPIPQGRPQAGAVLEGAGSYSLPRVPDGRYFLFAAGLARPDDPAEYFLHESALRGGGQAVSVCGDRIAGAADLCLRSAASFDPPLLMTLPLLLDTFARPESGPAGAGRA